MVLGSFEEQIPFLREKEGEKGEKLGFGKRSSFGGLCFPFLAPKRSNNMEEEI